MRLVRFRHGDRIATGAVSSGEDVVRILAGTFFENPLPTGEEVPLDDVRLLAPVLPSKLVCVGKNYAAHAAEFGMTVPEEPLLFLKPSTAVIGPHDPIQLLPISRRVDYEGELAVVIGALARNVRTGDAYRVILGYTCANDVTLRDLQKTDDQWARAKGFDGFVSDRSLDRDRPRPERDPCMDAVERRHRPIRRDTGHGLRGGDAGRVHHRVHDPPAGRRDPHGHAGGGRSAEPGCDVVEVEVDGVRTLSNPVVA